MASDSQTKDNTALSVNRMRLADRVKVIAKGIRMHFYSEYTEDRGGDVESIEGVQGGAVVGRFVHKDGIVAETSASSDAQESGEHRKMAEAAGLKADDVRSTVPSVVAKEMDPQKPTDMGKGPVEVGSISDKQADTPGKPEETVEADLHPKSQTGDSKGGGKPDGSLFKPKGDKDPGAEGDFKAESAKAPKQSEKSSDKGGKPDKSLSQMASMKTGPSESRLEKAYDIKVEPGKITYTHQIKGEEDQKPTSTSETPKWKQRWTQKSPAERQAFRQHLSQQRSLKTPSGSSMKKADDGKSEGYKKLIELMKKPKQRAPGSTDEKIKAALSHQADSGSPYAEPRSGHRGTQGPGTQGKNQLQSDAASMRSAADSANTTQAKPIVLKDMARYKKFTASGRPFRVQLGTHTDHKKMVGAHHVLSQPMTIKEVHAQLKNPTSELSRRVYDAVDSGHDSLYIHQPEGGGKQVGHLKVIKSIGLEMEALRKNVIAGYGQADMTGIPVDQQMAMSGSGNPWMPTKHTSRPEIMNKDAMTPETHSQHAKAFANRVRNWIAGRQNRAIQAKAQSEEAMLDNPARHMRKADSGAPPKPTSLKPAGVPASHNPKIRAVADSYAQSKGMKINHGIPHAEVNVERAGRIARAYHSAQHNPNHPDIKRSYDALINETADQFKHMKAAGLKITPIKPGQDNPYKTSKDMLQDLHTNNHLWYYPTEQGFGSGGESSDHPLLRTVETEHGPMVANDLFRIVHDYFGHAKEGFGFGPKGEENAWAHHMQMYSPDAQRALTAETRGQNSWVNFGPHGEHNRKNPGQTRYADQKATLLPDWALER